MRHGRSRFLLFNLVFFLSPLFPGARAYGAPTRTSKLGAHLHLVKSASRATLRALGRHLGIHADKPVPTVEVLIRARPGAHLKELAKSHPGGRFGSEIGGIVTAEVPLALLDDLEADPDVLGVQVSRRSKPSLDKVRSTAMAGGLFLGVLENAADLSHADGKGVIVGVIDTGIDYKHQDFKDSGGNTRLLAIWDQNCTVGCTPPAILTLQNPGGSYGNECSQASIQANTCSELDTDGHGTNVTGIAAGNGRAVKDNGIPAGTYTGIAKGADIIVVASSFTDLGVLDGMNYLVGKAASLGKDLVINMSFGGQGGGHDGTDFFESAISSVAVSTPVVVAMGNDNVDAPHGQMQFTSVGQSITSSVNTFTTSGSASYSEFIDTEFWYPGGDDYSIDVSVAGGPSGTVHWNPQEGGLAGTTKFLGAACPGSPCVSVYVANGTNTIGDRQLFVEVDDLGLGTLTSVSYKLTRAAGSVGSGFVDGYTQPSILGTSFADHISPNGTVTRPATTDNVFAVGAYNTKNAWPLDSLSPFDPSATCGTGTIAYAPPAPILGQIADFSGAGPRRNGASSALSTGTNGAKPDIVAPGQGIASSLSVDATPATCFVVDDGVHFIDQGTSQATPVVTGVIAVMLQVNPLMTVAQIRSALQATARNDGAGGFLPNDTYGPGKIVGAPTKVRAAPTSLTQAVLGTSSVTFSWSLVTNATSFNIYNGSPPINYVLATTANSLTPLGLAPNSTFIYESRAVNGYGEGPTGGTVFTGATLANQPVPVSITPFISSITVVFAAGVGGASGFTLVGSTSPGTYAGTLFSSATANGTSTTLSLLGLAQLTTYYLRLSALNPSGVANPALIGSALTLSPFVAPPLLPPSAFGQNQIQLNWAQGSNPSSVNYSADASTAANFTGTLFNIQGIDVFSALFTGLATNTSYYFRVKANAGPVSSTGPYATLAGLPTTTLPAFTNVTAASVVAQWGLGPNPAGTLFLVQVSVDPTPAFSPIASSSLTRNTNGLLVGLAPNTTYYARVQAISEGGVATAFAATGSISTLAAAPTPTVFTNQTTTGFTAGFTSTNGPGTLFVAQVSVDPTAAFSPVAAASQTANLFADFSGLVPNQQYFFRAGAISNGGVVNFNAFGAEISTFTAPVPPAAATPVASLQTASSLRLFWTSGGNAAGTLYTARICADPACVTIVQTISGIAALLQDFSTGLSANTSYFLQVQAQHLGPSNPDSAFVLLGSAPTLANPPPGSAVFSPITFTSTTATYPTLPAAPPDLTCEGYRIQASVDPAFATLAFSADVAGSASNTQGITGLLPATTYFVRVGSLNWDGHPNFSASVATMTLIPIQSTGTVTVGGLTLIVLPQGEPVTSLQLVIPPAALPTGTVVTINTSVGYLLPPALSNEAVLTAMASGVGFSLDAAGMQPVREIDVIIKYDPLQLPLGFTAKNIQLARYDGGARQWTLLPTTVDTTQNAAVGRINHFSLFAPLLVTPANDLQNANVFPMPWEPNSGNSLLNAPQLTFSNLVAGSTVKITTLAGALVFDGTAGANGVMTWDGKNRFGRTMGSGTYLALIDGGGDTVVKRVVIIR
ncbi:MAG: S8 family serine peptidase [Elusimicrobia bacterium]|nr:S8 family serine peptidase [Elusimicrobiota bacterium]